MSRLMSSAKYLKEVEYYKVLSWNLDGLCEKEVVVRTIAAIDKIREIKPCIVFLQEVTELTESLLTKHLSGPYVFVRPSKSSNWMPTANCSTKSSCDPMPYFCLILISKLHWQLVEEDRSLQNGLTQSMFNVNRASSKIMGTGHTYYYPGTRMGRHLLTAKIQTAGGEEGSAPTVFLIATTHLESLKDR